MSALRLPEDLHRARTHVLHIYVHARSDHGGAVAKYFHVLDASVIKVARAVNFPATWPATLLTLRGLQDESERMGRGAVAACMVECGPLGMRALPFASLRNLRHHVDPDWKRGLIEYVEEGKKPTGR